MNLGASDCFTSGRVHVFTAFSDSTEIGLDSRLSPNLRAHVAVGTEGHECHLRACSARRARRPKKGLMRGALAALRRTKSDQVDRSSDLACWVLVLRYALVAVKRIYGVD